MSAESPESADTYASWCAEHYASSARLVAAKLRDLADQVDRAAERTDDTQGYSEGRGYAYSAAQVVHHVTWGLANMNLDQLVRSAATADHARRGADL